MVGARLTKKAFGLKFIRCQLAKDVLSMCTTTSDILISNLEPEGKYNNHELC